MNHLGGAGREKRETEKTRKRKREM
jgi:hypothetical protein